MYLLDFVNNVRRAQGSADLDYLPRPGADGSSPLELAMGCRLEPGIMRLPSPQAAASVAHATGLPVSADPVTVALPAELIPHSGELHASRQVAASEPRHGEAALTYS